MNPVVTQVAHAGSGEHMFMGHRVLRDLLGAESLTGLFALSVLGRRVTREEQRLLDGLAVAVTAADPRIWPLKASRLVASYGDVLAGRAAGQLAMMGTYLGPRIIEHAAAHLHALSAALEGAATPEEEDDILRVHAASTRRLAGWGVPFRAEDERLRALCTFVAAVGRDRLPHWRAQERLAAFLLRDRGLPANVGSGVAAALLDIGCSPSQAGVLGTLIHTQDFDANVYEAAKQRAPQMQRLPVSCIEYVGVAPRTSPRAREEAGQTPRPRVTLQYEDDGLPLA